MNDTVQTNATARDGTESAMTDTIALETVGLTKRYGKTTALQGCTLALFMSTVEEVQREAGQVEEPI